MKRVSALFLFCLACAGAAAGQGRPIDSPLLGGDAQRTGWEKTDSRITHDNVKDFQLVLKQKLEKKPSGPRSLSAPVIIGTLISYRGFKELAFVADGADDLWALDADLERMFWQRHFDVSGPKTSAGKNCSAGVTPSLIPPVNFAARRPAKPAATQDAAPAPKPAGPAFLNGNGFGSPRPVFALAGDGKVHVLNTATGEDVVSPIPFLPANARASSLTFSDGVLYTTTTGKCGKAPDAVWALDLATGGASTFAAPGGGLPEPEGLAIGTDGTVYTRSASGAVAALNGKDLKLLQSFEAPAAAHKAAANSMTPLVFAYKEHDLIVSASNDGGLVLLDSQALSTPLYQTGPLTSGVVWGGLSSWQDAAGTRWIYAPVWGAVNAQLAGLVPGGAQSSPQNGAIVALKLEEQEGKPVLTPAWVSGDMASPEPPVITAGTVFALAAGGARKGSGHATLYALDAATGKEMYSTKNEVVSAGSLSGLTLANGRVYFTTTDGTLYAFGIYLER